MRIKKRFSLVERDQIVEKSQRCLWSDSGKPGLEYLVSQRGLSEETIREFQLGYIPKFIRHQLQGRVIFPLTDPSGNLIAVSSRAIEKDTFLPVYWHESYEKLFYLYGIRQAREAIQEARFTLVVEGQFDALQLHNHKIRNVVALSGNKMSEVQISVLHRYCKEIVLLLDADANLAGQRGADKVLAHSSIYQHSRWVFKSFPAPPGCESDQDIQSVETRNLLSVRFPENLDPDEFVRKYGAKELKKVVKEERREFYNRELER